jgi:hypothetical protein
MGDKTMKPHFEVDKTTNVAYLDVAQADPDAKIRVIEVSIQLGLRSRVLARVDFDNQKMLGLIIEDYKAFKREIRLKYFAWRVERIAELLLCSIRDIAIQKSSDDHRLAHV